MGSQNGGFSQPDGGCALNVDIYYLACCFLQKKFILPQSRPESAFQLSIP